MFPYKRNLYSKSLRYEIIPIPRGSKILLPKNLNLLPGGFTLAITCSEKIGINGTLEAVRRLSDKDFNLSPHIPARMVENKTQLTEIIKKLDAYGVKDIFVPGGDIEKPRGIYTSAYQLLYDISHMNHSIERFGITGYPQGHYDISDFDLKCSLLAKNKYADYIVTQICTNPKDIKKWLNQISGYGVDLPVYIGAIGIVERKRLYNIAKGFGFRKSSWFGLRNLNIALQMIKPQGYNPSRVLKEVVFEKNVRGFHINTFNSLKKTEKWRLSQLNKRS